MKKIKNTLIYLLLIAGIFVVIGPFVYMFFTSLTTDNYSIPSPHKLIFDAKSFNNYSLAWSKNHFQQYFFNSIFITLITVVLAISLAASTAYAFARFTFPLKELLFKAFIFTMILPSLLNIIPQFTIIKALGLVDTHAGLILLYVGSGVVGGTFFIRGFFERIPVELEESIVIDGGGRFTIFRSIYIPLSLPALGTWAILSFSGTWDEFTVALTLLKTESLRTLPIALQLFRGQYATSYGLFFAASIIALIPIMVIFAVFQKQFVNPNQSDGSVKG
ncbi:carbohydrate ABC transporter permease [Paenibacillus psychroresistens]|uniref:Carbohydrate ABC transporter permease n=1 Tax=Paenibacillus psychroresistens TaxID=1778678 RepID=A0A6B8RQI7_9BACL|nr:carbohydrate ABC transporter permease [Paenibacillus psychroresistens]QGQ97972.1 carbohydrate ABC transporter permease [Paenibacillus psychroresistens]